MYINICKHKYLPLMDLHSAQPRCCVCLCEYPVSLPVFICVAGHVDLDICSVHICVCVRTYYTCPAMLLVGLVGMQMQWPHLC